MEFRCRYCGAESDSGCCHDCAVRFPGAVAVLRRGIRAAHPLLTSRAIGRIIANAPDALVIKADATGVIAWAASRDDADILGWSLTGPTILAEIRAEFKAE